MGIGNPLLGDDVAGLMAARLLCELIPEDQDVEILEHASGTMQLIEKIMGKDIVILVDLYKTDANYSTPLDEFSYPLLMEIRFKEENQPVIVVKKECEEKNKEFTASEEIMHQFRRLLNQVKNDVVFAEMKGTFKWPVENKNGKNFLDFLLDKKKNVIPSDALHSIQSTRKTENVLERTRPIIREKEMEFIDSTEDGLITPHDVSFFSMLKFFKNTFEEEFPKKIFLLAMKASNDGVKLSGTISREVEIQILHGIKMILELIKNDYYRN